MELLKGTITFVDIIESDAKERLDEDLRVLSNVEKNPQSMNWGQMSDSGGTYTDWKLKKIPDELSFLESITIRVLQFHRFKFGYMILTQGELIKEEIKKMNDKEENYEELEELRKKFWKFCKDKIRGKVAMSKKDFLFIDGVSINHYIEKFEWTGEILGPGWNDTDEMGPPKWEDDEIREEPILKKLGIQTVGLLSYFRPYETKLTLVGQHNSVGSGSDYDYSGITIIDFLNDDKQFVYDGMFYHEHERILKLLFSYLWFRYRHTQIPKWKEEINELSKEIKNSGDSFTQEDLNQLLKDKGIFVVNAVSNIDEDRSVKKYLEFDEKRNKDHYWIEFPILKSPNFPNMKGGIKENLMESVRWYTDNIKEEFDVLREQFEEISTHVTDVVGTKTADSSLKLQGKLKFSTYVTIGLTVGLFILAAAQYNSSLITSELMEDFRDIQDELLDVESSALASQYKDFEIELEYEFKPNYKEDAQETFVIMDVKNIGKYDSSINHKWGVTGYCDDSGDIIEPPSSPSNTGIVGIHKEKSQKYSLHHDEIYSVDGKTKSFELMIEVEAYPKTAKKTIEDPKRRSITMIQLDLIDGIWTPRFNNFELDCKPLEEYSTVKLNTKNINHFNKMQ